MKLNDYQTKALTTCMPSCNNFSYMFLNLVGEIGELASKIAKAIRKDEASINRNNLEIPIGCRSYEQRQALLGEVGDCLWQLSGVCYTLGFTLEEVAEYNLNKLASRKERGVIDGNGDNR